LQCGGYAIIGLRVEGAKERASKEENKTLRLNLRPIISRFVESFQPAVSFHIICEARKADQEDPEKI